LPASVDELVRAGPFTAGEVAAALAELIAGLPSKGRGCIALFNSIAS
jgi:hypothetical protein